MVFWCWKDVIQSWLDYLSVLNRNVYICQRCGVMHAPFLGGVIGPRSGGWKKVKKGCYRCHFCLEHADYCSKEEIEERMELVLEGNSKLEGKIWFWQVNYPWAKVRYKGGTKDEKNIGVC